MLEMEDIVKKTECTYEGLEIDMTVVQLIAELELMVDRDLGESYEAMYTNPRVLHGVWGIECEIAEIKDALKKSLFYRKKLDTSNLLTEIGDCLYFVVLLEDEYHEQFYGTRDLLDKIAQHYNSTLNKCTQMVAKKLSKRYPDGFSTEAATNRAEDDN